MNLHQSVLIVFFLGAVTALFLFPPYMTLDISSNGQIHGGLGHFPVWEPPTQQHALAILSESGVVPEGGVRASDLAIRRNVVGLTIYTIGLCLLSLIGFRLLRTRRGQPDSEGHTVGT